MNIEKHTKKMYDTYGKKYQKTREEKHLSRLYNEFLEVPSMIKAVGKIRNKSLLDIGCGAGIHIKHYLKSGAKCSGIDLSKTMITLAKQNCPNVDFKIGSMNKLPFKDASFDIVTASLSMHYIDNLNPVLKEINRVLKTGWLFYYSDESPIASTRERYEDDDFKIVGIGKFIDKKSGKTIVLGNSMNEGLVEREMVPGMIIKSYKKTFRTQLQELTKANFELVDFIDCKPISDFKKYNPDSYKVYTKFPLFSIYVSKKK